MELLSKEERKSFISSLSKEEKKQLKDLVEKKMCCMDCGRVLGRKSLEYNIFLCGFENLDKLSCLRCSAIGIRNFRNELSCAVFGEDGHYDEIDFDDFPGFR